MTGQRYSAREAANALGRSAATLRRWVADGRLDARRGRGGWTYTKEDVQLLRQFGAAWITSSQVARALGRSNKTVNAWADTGLLVCRRGQGGWRWFDRDSVAAMARRLIGRRRLNGADRAELLSEVGAG